MVELKLARRLVVGVLVALGSLVPLHAEPLPAAPVTRLIFVDDLHISFRDTGYLRTLFKSIATDLVRDGDSFAVQTSGPSSVSIALGSDRAILDAAIPRFAGNELTPNEIASPELDAELRYRAKVAGTAAADMLNSLPTATFGVALLYISDGYSRTPVDPTLAGLPQTAHQLEATIFALSPHGLRNAPQVTPSGSPAVSEHYREIMMKSLRAIAEPTGGFAVLQEVDFEDALQRIGRAMR